MHHQKTNTIPGELVEMDTVIGRVGGKALLTIQFSVSHFMLAFLLKDKSAASVVSTFYNIRMLLEKYNISFKDVQKNKD